MAIKDLNCAGVTKLKDIQKEDVIDDNGGNKPADKKLVSCLQTHYLDKYGNKVEYNELKEIVKEKFPNDINNPALYKALCECCKEKEAPKTEIRKILDSDKTQRELFYECLEKKNIEIILGRIK